MKTYTVVGFYDDTGQRFCSSVQAETYIDAITYTFQNYPNGDLAIVEVFEGDLDPLTCSSKVEYREDWPGLEEEDELDHMSSPNGCHEDCPACAAEKEKPCKP